MRSQAVQAPTKSDVRNVNDVGLKDVPLRSLFPEEPAPPRAVRRGGRCVGLQVNMGVTCLQGGKACKDRIDRAPDAVLAATWPAVT